MFKRDFYSFIINSLDAQICCRLFACTNVVRILDARVHVGLSGLGSWINGSLPSKNEILGCNRGAVTPLGIA